MPFFHKGYHYNKICKTQLNMTKISFKFKRLIATAASFSLSCVASQLGIIKKKHKAVIKKHLLNSYSLTSYGTHFLVKTCISKLYSSNPEMNTFRQV